VTVALGYAALWLLAVALTGMRLDRGALILFCVCSAIGVPAWIYLERFDEPRR
jgi:hypothetical protein